MDNAAADKTRSNIIDHSFPRLWRTRFSGILIANSFFSQNRNDAYLVITRLSRLLLFHYDRSYLSSCNTNFSSVSKIIRVGDFGPSISAHAYDTTRLYRERFALQTIGLAIATAVASIFRRCERHATGALWTSRSTHRRRYSELCATIMQRKHRAELETRKMSAQLDAKQHDCNWQLFRRTHETRSNERPRRSNEVTTCDATERYSTGSVTIANCWCNCIDKIHRRCVNAKFVQRM